MVKYVSLLSKIILLASAVSIQSAAAAVPFFEEEIDKGPPSVTSPQSEFTEEQLNTLDRQLSALYEMKGQKLRKEGAPLEVIATCFEKAGRYDLAQKIYEEEYYKTTSHGVGLDCYEKAKAYGRKHNQCMTGQKAKDCY